MKKFIRILCILLIVSMPVLAQEEELGVEGQTLGAVTIDGWLSLLLAAGASLGGRRRYPQGDTKRRGE